MDSVEGGASAPPVVQVILSDDVTRIQRDNIRSAIARLESGEVLPFERDQRPRRSLHTVGGGHSAAETISDIDGDICAVNGAHDWLLGQGIVPDYALFLDWSDLLSKHVTPHSGVIYLLASQCHPALFDVLAPYKVRVWHTGTAAGYVPGGTQMFGGGPNAAQRVIPVLYEYGYRDFHFHGVDACTNSTSHVYPWGVAGQTGMKPMTVTYAGRTFNSRMDWVDHAQWFERFLPIYRQWIDEGRMEEITIKVHGDGLIPHIARIHGCHVHSVNMKED